MWQVFVQKNANIPDRNKVIILSHGDLVSFILKEQALLFFPCVSRTWATYEATEKGHWQKGEGLTDSLQRPSQAQHKCTAASCPPGQTS